MSDAPCPIAVANILKRLRRRSEYPVLDVVDGISRAEDWKLAADEIEQIQTQNKDFKDTGDTMHAAALKWMTRALVAERKLNAR